jgi:hypothetical protein
MATAPPPPPRRKIYIFIVFSDLIEGFTPKNAKMIGMCTVSATDKALMYCTAHLTRTFSFVFIFVSLPQVRIQEIKRMLVMYLTHGLFLTCTQKSRFVYKSCIAIFTKCTAICQNQPLASAIKQPRLLTWRASFFAHGDKSHLPALVSGLPTTSPPIVGFYTPQFKLHYVLVTSVDWKYGTWIYGYSCVRLHTHVTQVSCCDY